jgi:hypothetical protein
VVSDLAPFSTCRPVFMDYSLRRMKVAIQAPRGQEGARQKLLTTVQPLADPSGGLVELVNDPQEAHWVLRLDQDKLELFEASGNRPPFALPPPGDPELLRVLRQSLEKIARARNLVALAGRFENENYRGSQAVNIDVEVLRHTNPGAPGEVDPAPASGFVFRPGNLVSFRVHNRSAAMRVDVTLLIVGSDFEIHSFYPQPNELGQSLEPGQSLTTPPPPGEISNEPPFGPECLVVIAAPAKNPPVDFTSLAQGGLALARGADPNGNLRSPLGELLESAMFQSGARRGLGRSVVAQHGMRILNWRTQPK